MTADDARKLTGQFKDDTAEKAQVLLKHWYALIEKAAREGRTSVTEDELPTLRMPIPAMAFQIARETLIESGFAVSQVKVGVNEYTWRVSWEAK